RLRRSTRNPHPRSPKLSSAFSRSSASSPICTRGGTRSIRGRREGGRAKPSIDKAEGGKATTTATFSEAGESFSGLRRTIRAGDGGFVFPSRYFVRIVSVARETST